MYKIMQGDACWIPVCIYDEDTAISPDMVEAVEISIGNVTKKYPGEISFSEHWMFPLSQQDTYSLSPNLQSMQVRVKFVNGEISGTDCGLVSVNFSVSREVL